MSSLNHDQLNGILEIAAELKTRYGDFRHYNRSNPLDELIFIICSTKTDEKNYLTSYKNLKRSFPTFLSLSRATPEQLFAPLRIGGLYNQKAHHVNKVLQQIVTEFGKPTLAPLKKFTDDECESFLMSLPGVGKKVARCIMMYSLNRQVFPVDTHCWRISQRLGLVPPERLGKRYTDNDVDKLQDSIPAGIRYSLHVNMVSLGREFCTPRKPNCRDCPINRYCSLAAFHFRTSGLIKKLLRTQL